MEKSVESAGYDIKKLPLGQLSDETVKKGYEQLREIEAVLLKIKDGKASKSSVSSKLQELSNKFYCFIPHNFGFKKMSNFVIDTNDKLKEKLDSKSVSNYEKIESGLELRFYDSGTRVLPIQDPDNLKLAALFLDAVLNAQSKAIKQVCCLLVIGMSYRVSLIRF